MTGRTHDLAAFTALNYLVLALPLHHTTLATAGVAFCANLIGGIAPDIDQPTASLWRRLPAGSLIGRLLTPMLGGHRFISHSILGIFLFGFLLHWGLALLSTILLVDMNVVWNAFMIGFISHLLMDTITKEGVPWLFPIPIHFGIPPLKFLRIKTGGIVEKAFVFPVLLMTNVYLFFIYHGKILDFLRHHIK